MKKILVPCDFSKPSIDAFRAAVRLAAKVHGSVTVLHVIFLPAEYDPGFHGGYFNDPGLITKLEDEAEKAFADMIKDLPAGSPTVNLAVEIGGVLDIVQETIREKNIDLVMMSTTGASGLMELLVGSFTEKVVRHATVPVLAIPKGTVMGAVSHILLPSLLSLDQTAFMQKVQELQKFHNATLKILHVNTPLHFRRDADATEAMEAFARHYNLKNFTLHFVNDYTEEAGIVAFANREKTDLIAMGTHARKGLAHMFHTNITEDLVNHIQCPVWTYTLHPL